MILPLISLHYAILWPGLVRFCTTAKKYPDLYGKLKKSSGSSSSTKSASTSMIDCEQVLLHQHSTGPLLRGTSKA